MSTRIDGEPPVGFYSHTDRDTQPHPCAAGRRFPAQVRGFAVISAQTLRNVAQAMPAGLLQRKARWKARTVVIDLQTEDRAFEHTTQTHHASAIGQRSPMFHRI